MPEQPTPDFPLPYLPEQQPPKKSRRRYKLLVMVFAIAGLLLVAAVSAYLLLHRPDANNAPTKRVFTYYYRDGKTILWQGVELFAADSPSFVHRVANELTARYSQRTFRNGDWKIITTLDKPLQDVAEQQVEAHRDQLDRQKAQDAAFMAQDVATGQIVSWVVGLDNKIKYSDDDKLSTKTQAGTLALPLVYAAYIDNTNTDADSTVDDTQRPLAAGYPCANTALPKHGGDCLHNFDNKYSGKITLRQALGGLRLVPAVEAMTSVVANDTSAGRVESVNKAIATIEAMMGNHQGYGCYDSRKEGDTSLPDFNKEWQCFGAAALGDHAYAAPQDLIQAYATLSNNGNRLLQTSWLRLEQDGKLVDQWKAPKGEQAVKADTSHIINDILSDPDASYMARKSWFRIANTKISVMTGTTHDASVASTVQYSSKYAVGFWAFGGEDPSQRIKGFTETLALPPASGWLTAAHHDPAN